METADARQQAWERLFPPGRAAPLDVLDPEARSAARRTAELILAAHRQYLDEFNALTTEARQVFEDRAWTQGALNAGRRVQLYRDAVNETWRKIRRLFPSQLPGREFWMGTRQAFLEEIFDEYWADLALTFFYSTMRISFDESDSPVEYDDDGLAERPHVRSMEPVVRCYHTYPDELSSSVEEILGNCEFTSTFEQRAADAKLATARIMGVWHQLFGREAPCTLQVLRPVFFRDREAYVVGKLCSAHSELPVVFALRHERAGIKVDAVLAGKEDMRNILFVSTRSTFLVHTDSYREVLAFLDTLAPERGHPAMCAVIGFTHPARVALNQSLRRHLKETGERFLPTPGRVGMAMVVFSPPSFPYVFKVIRDFSSKAGWKGRQQIMDLYRWVHEMNRGRLMLDAWLYRNLHFPRRAFHDGVLDELVSTAPSSVRLDGETVILKHVYAQRRVQPLSTFFEETHDRARRERAVDLLCTFIEELAGMGLFIGDCYGLPSNTGLTHSSNVALFDFDDLGLLLRSRFRTTPPRCDEGDEFLWNTESDGAWFSVGEDDVLVDEWERLLGVPPDLQTYFRERHGRLFTVDYWTALQQRVLAGKLHFVLPYPAERRLRASG